MLLYYKGFALALLSMFFAGIGSLLFKESVQRIGAGATTIFYYIFGLVFSLLLVFLHARKLELSNQSIGWAIAAALSLCLSVLCFNSSLNSLNVSTSATIYSMAFVVTIVGAVLFQQEKLVTHDYIAALLAIGAVVVFGLKPT